MNNNWRYNDREIELIKGVLLSGFTSSTSGNACQTFEAEFCKVTGAKYCIVMNSGTSTLHAALAAFGVGPSDEVIVPALTVVSTANAVIFQNAVPIFADIDPYTFNIDPKDIERKITPRTKAIIPVALYGLCPDMDEIMLIAKRHGLKVVVDAAEAHFSKYKGKDIALLGDMTSFSFENSKILSCGDGGCLVTDNPEYATRARKFASQGYKSITSAEGRIRINKDVFQDPTYERHNSLGWNYRLPEICGAVLSAQLEKKDMFVQYRREIALAYIQMINETDCDFLMPQLELEGYENSYWCFTCNFNEKKAGCTWQEFRKKYIEFGGDGIYAAWVPTYLEPVYKNYNFYGLGCPHKCPLYQGKVEYKKGLCPITERIQPHLMQFVNNYEGLKEAEPKILALKKTIQYFQKAKQ